MIQFWDAIFRMTKERQERGESCGYDDVIVNSLGLYAGILKRVPDLRGIDIDYDLVEAWLSLETLPIAEREKERTRRDSLAYLQASTLENEEWRSIPGFPDYLVSSEGRVWSLRRRQGLMTPQPLNGTKYLYLDLRNEYGVSRMRVHRAVALAFLENPEGKEQVDHINEDPSDNRLDNLRWVSAEENIENYMRNHGYWYKK